MDWTAIAQVFTVGATIQFWIASIFVGFIGYYLIRLIVINKKKYNEIDNYRKSVMNSVQMEYNKRLAEEAQQEIKKTIEDYPQYREEILSMVNRFQSRIA